MISKELLSEVLEVGIDIVDHYTKDNNLYYSFSRSSTQHINIYELAHKCKEWAKNKGYLLLSGYDDGKTFYCTCSNKSSPDSYSGTEPEAIFKVCQWILDNKETK